MKLWTLLFLWVCAGTAASAQDPAPVCAPPSIDFLYAWPFTLPEPGATTIGWNTQNADSVKLLPQDEALDPQGYREIQLDATVTYQIEATNACGSVTRDITLAVAEPGVSTMLVDRAMPGQLITLSPGNLDDPVRLHSVVFRFDDGLLIPAPTEFRNGVYEFYVPYVYDEEAPDGYRHGAASILLQYDDHLSPAVPFRIDALPVPENATGKFQDLIFTLLDAGRAQTDAQKQVPGWESAAEDLLTAGQTAAPELVRMLHDLDSNDTAALPADVMGPTEDGAQIQVSRRLIEHLVAMSETPLLIPTDPDAASTDRKPKPRAAGAAGPCLQDDLQYATCLNSEALAVIHFGNGPVMSMLSRAVTMSQAGLWQPRGTTRACAINRQALTPIILISHLFAVLRDSGIGCKLYPTKPVGLSAVPVPDPLPVGPMESSGNKGTEVRLRLEPYWTPEFTVKEFFDTLYTASVLRAANNLVNPNDGIQCSLQFAQAFTQFASEVWARNQQAVLAALQKATADFPAYKEATLYKCDLADVYGADGALLHRSQFDDDQAFRWGLEALQSGTHPLRVSPILANFPSDMFYSDYSRAPTGDPCAPGPRLFKPSLEQDYTPISPCAQVSATGPKLEVSVNSLDVFSYQDEGPHAETAFHPPQVVDDGSPVTQSDNGYGASTSIQVERTYGNKWTVTQNVSGATGDKLITTWNNFNLNIVNQPAPRLVRVKVTSTIQGTCQGLYVRFGSINEESDQLSGCPAEWTMEQSTSSAQPSLTLDLRVSILGGRGAGFGAGAGTITTEIELLDQLQP